MTHLNYTTETARLEKLEKIVRMIRQCDSFIMDSEDKLSQKKPNNWQLFQSRTDLSKKLEAKKQARNRLLKYYARHVFALASNTYNMITPLRRCSSVRREAA